MPLAKIHVVEGRYDQARIAKVSGAIQAALMNTLHVPPDDFWQAAWHSLLLVGFTAALRWPPRCPDRRRRKAGPARASARRGASNGSAWSSALRRWRQSDGHGPRRRLRH